MKTEANTIRAGYLILLGLLAVLILTWSVEVQAETEDAAEVQSEAEDFNEVQSETGDLDEGVQAEDEDAFNDDWDLGWEDELLAETEAVAIADPLEPLNRFFFQFNDRLYFWVLKPVASNYAEVVPEDVRGTIANFFQNLVAPVRIVNNLLQGKPKGTGIEFSRFLINSTLGIAGLADPAKNEFGLEPQYEDLGQTLGYYGLGGGFYIVWPLLGPSNLRDTIGFLGDSYLSPLDYYTREETAAGIGINSGEVVNRASFRIGNYEQFKESAFDPYLALRDAYQQHRHSMIEDQIERSSQPFYTESVRGLRRRAALRAQGLRETTNVSFYRQEPNK